MKELKAFARAALAPGETRTLTLTVPRDSLGYYDEAAKGWAFESGEYRVFAGGSGRTEGMLVAKVAL